MRTLIFLDLRDLGDVPEALAQKILRGANAEQLQRIEANSVSSHSSSAPSMTPNVIIDLRLVNSILNFIYYLGQRSWYR